MPVLIILFIVLVVILVWILIKLLEAVLSSAAPLIPTPPEAYAQIERALKIKPGQEVWDIGCGEANLLRHMATGHSSVYFIGVENSPVVWAKAKLTTRHLKNVRIYFGDMNKYPPRSATSIYLYLLPKTLKTIVKSIPSGCRVVTLEYQLTSKKPIDTIKLKSPSKLATTLYVYQM